MKVPIKIETFILEVSLFYFNCTNSTEYGLSSQLERLVLGVHNPDVECAYAQELTKR